MRVCVRGRGPVCVHVCVCIVCALCVRVGVYARACRVSLFVDTCAPSNTQLAPSHIVASIVLMW